MKIGPTIYLDHQATTPVAQSVFSQMTPYFGEKFGNPHSADHSIGWRASKAVEGAAAKVAELIGADANEIVFTSGATEANNLALLGVGRHEAGGKRRRILVSAIEHKCVLQAARVLEKDHGYHIGFIPVDHTGCVDLQALDDMLTDDVLIVSVMAVNNEIGSIQNIAKISELVGSVGAFFHCDAAQAPCALDLSLFAGLTDLLSLSAHKMYGPQGIGALFVRHGLEGHIEPLIHGGGQQSGLRSGTVPLALSVGMGAAAALFNDVEVTKKRLKLRGLTDDFVARLRALPWQVHLNGPLGAMRHPGNANVQFVGFVASDLLGVLQPHLAASTGSACTSGIPEPSHVLRAIGLPTKSAEASIRFSLGWETTAEDVEQAVALVRDALSRIQENDTSSGRRKVEAQLSWR